MITTSNYIRRSWEEWYSEAEAYFFRYGNLLVPELYVTEDGVRLGRWIERMRAAYAGKLKNSALSAEQVRMLEVLGMVWRLERRSGRGEWLRRAAAYKAAHGDLLVPSDYNPDGFCLGLWIAEMRKRYNSGTLSPEETAELDALGMVWRLLDVRGWDEHYSDALAYSYSHGNLLVPLHYETPEGHKLGQWIFTCRKAYRKEPGRAALTPEQITALEQIGMVWDVSSVRLSRWYDMYDFVKARKAATGSLPLSPGELCAPDGRKPRMWIAYQRRALSSGKATPEQERLLGELGIRKIK